MGSGAYADISLDRSEDKYELVRLDELEYQGKAFFGIPKKTHSTKGHVFRFNGLDLGKTPRIAPVLSLIGYGLATTLVVRRFSSNYLRLDRPLPISILVAVPISGALNNLTWSGAALQSATWEVNNNLLLYNPDIDLFLNPKYELDYKIGLFTQLSNVKANVMGVKIITDNDVDK